MSEKKEQTPVTMDKMLGTETVTVNIDGKDYRLNEPLLVDYAMFRDRLRDEKRVEARKVAEDFKDLGLSDESVIKEYNQILNGFGATDVHAAKTTKGARFFFWRCCQKYHPEMTETKAAKLINDENAMEVIVAVNELEQAYQSRMLKKKEEIAKRAAKNLTGVGEVSTTED